MPISTTGTVHWRWNEQNISQFGTQYNLGPVTGTVTLSYKAATGSFMPSPTIRVEMSDGFNTPSGSIALIAINDIDELPKNIRVRFITSHFSTSNNVTSTSARYSNLLWGVVANASSGSTRDDYCGTFYAIPFFRDVFVSPKPINAGQRNAGAGPGTWSDSRSGMITSSFAVHDLFLKHLSMTGSSLSGTDIEAWTTCVQNPQKANELTSNSHIGFRGSSYSSLHWSGSAFSGKKLTKAYLGFSYDPPSANYSPITGTYFEFDNFIILRHPSGNGEEFQPPPLTMSMFSGMAQPPALTGLTYWSQPSGSLVTISTNKVTAIGRFSGSSHIFGNAAASAPFTSSLLINGTTYPTALFSGASAFLTSSTNHSAYISGSAFRNYYVVNIVTGSLNSTTTYQNHVIHGDTGGWWGIYYRNKGNGSGSIYGYGWTSSENTASLDFKFGETILFEYYRDATTMYVKLNNSASLSKAGLSAFAPSSGNPSQLGKTTDPTSAWHLIEMVTTNANTINTSGTLGVGNYLAQKYGLATGSLLVVDGGEAW